MKIVNMLSDYFQEYKKYIVSIFSVLLVFIIAFFYFPENKEDIKNNVKEEKKSIALVTQQVLEEAIPSNKEEIKKTKVVKIKPKKVQKIIKEEKEIVLLSTYSNDNRYSLKLISKKKLNNLPNDSKYIIVTGSISDGYKESTFPMSIKKDFIEDTSFLTLQIKDTKNSIESICDGYFLDSLSSGFSYNMKIEVSENTSECYIVSQSDFVEENYSENEEEYTDMKDGVKGVLSKNQTNNIDIKELKKMKIEDILN